MFAVECQWPTRTDLDRPLVIGAVLFGIGWGLSGLCPGPALENLATLSPRVFVFVAALVVGMVVHDAWQRHRAILTRRAAGAATAAAGDG
jgi:uncharacterized membrane protein YedE/YeeE